jgi:hypothetical protein
MKVIAETYHAHLIQYLHLYWCEVPDESYFRNVSWTLNSISTFVLMWGTFTNVDIELRCMISFWNNFHQLPDFNTNVDIELSVHDTFLE